MDAQRDDVRLPEVQLVSTHDRERYGIQHEKIHVKQGSAMNKLRLQLKALHDTLANSDDVLSECSHLMAENASLKEVLEALRKTSLEEAKSLRKSLADQEEAVRTRESELQCTIDSLRDELDAKQGLLQKFQNLHLDQRSSDHSGARKRETVEEQLQRIELERQEMEATILRQRHEIETLQRKAAEATEAAAAKRYKSVCVSVGTSELLSIASISLAQKASGSSNSSQPATARQKKRGSARKSRPTGLTCGDEETVDLAEHASQLSSRRRELLDGFPEIDVVLPEGTENVYFSKTLLSQILGGSMQGLVVRITGSAKPLAIEWNIEEYLCPKMDHNPWAPTGAGKHGFMQVGLGQDKARFNKPEIRHIFVGAGGRFKYSGKYEVMRVEALSVSEWKTLPEKVRHEYSKTTSIKEKHQKHGTIPEILRKYNEGSLRAPCVLLKCVEFDINFYRDLVAAARSFPSFGGKASAYSTQASPRVGKGKRKDPPMVNENHPDSTIDASPNKRARTSASGPSVARRSSRISTARNFIEVQDSDAAESDLSSCSELESDWESDD